MDLICLISRDAGSIGSSQIYMRGWRLLGNGVDQAAIVGLRPDPPVQKITFQALAATDLNNAQGGFRVGAMSSGVNNASNVYAVTAGTFTDRLDGRANHWRRSPRRVRKSSYWKRSDTSPVWNEFESQFHNGKSLNLTLSGGQCQGSEHRSCSGPFAGSGHDSVGNRLRRTVGDTARLTQ